MKLRPLPLAVTLSLSLLSYAHATEAGDWLKVDGFGTIGALKADEPDITVRTDGKTSTGSKNDVRLDADSQLTVQGTINPTGKLQGVLQLLSKKNIGSSNSPKVEWAYLGWQASDNLNIKLGRVVAPVFMQSDFRNLNYAQTAARPSLLVYPTNPISYLDGGSIRWSTTQGENEFVADAIYGKTTLKLAIGVLEIKGTGAALRWTNGPLSVRGEVLDLNIPTASLPTTAAQVAQVAGFDAKGLCTNCAAVLADRVKFANAKGKMYTVGASYESEAINLLAEYVDRTSDTLLIPKVTGWYAQASRRYGDWTPFVSYGKLNFNEPDLGLQATAKAPAVIVTTLANANESRLNNRGDRDILTLGTRWDFYSNLALKLQWDQFKIKYPRFGTNGGYQYATPNNNFDGKINLYTVNVDFIF